MISNQIGVALMATETVPAAETHRSSPRCGVAGTDRLSRFTALSKMAAPNGRHTTVVEDVLHAHGAGAGNGKDEDVGDPRAAAVGVRDEVAAERGTGGSPSSAHAGGGVARPL